MAASRRSPLMRDQWRADDDNRLYRDYRERERPERRARSPTTTSRRPEAVDFGLKIKGRATAESSDRPITIKREREIKAERSPSPRRALSKVLPHSPRRRVTGEGFKRERELSEERTSRRSRARENPPSPKPRRRPRSVTPEQRRHAEHHERRRSRSPRQTDRGVNPSDRRRERAHTPLYSPRRDQYLPPRDRQLTPKDRSAGDSYVPITRRRRSRSPEQRNRYRPAVSRRDSPSPERYDRHRQDNQPRRHELRRDSPHNSRRPSPTNRRPSTSHSRRERSPDANSTQKPKDSKSSKRSEKQKLRTLKHLVNKPKHIKSTRTSSPSPTRHKDDRRMQSSTRPIQSILDEHPRQPSPPRPIPSFDDSNGSADSHIRDAFPMHGMKATDMHPGQRRIPAHIDTRQSFATSPQYMTPTSSHHGSPQSGSPYSHGRGGWAGQQHFHGQPG